MTDPLGQYWDQPNRENILVDDQVALMSKEDFDQLGEYSHSIPTGKYVGKMWKAQARDGTWLLLWYDTNADPNYLSIPRRKIIVC